MKWQGALHETLVHLYFVRVFCDDIQLSKPFIVDERRCADLGAVLDITMSINVGDGLPIARIAEEFHRVVNDGLVGVFISSTSSCGNRLTKPSKAGDRFILDDSVHWIHHESVREVPS